MKRAIVTGMIATYPVGGVAWDYGQYLLGLEALGYETYYLEDTGAYTYDPVQQADTEDCGYSLAFLRNSLASLSPTLADRWHFRAANGETYGIPKPKLCDLIGAADLFLNVSGSTLLRDEYMTNRCKVLIDSDPGWNHFVNYPKWDASPGWQGTHGYRAHDHFLTYAVRIGKRDCALPTMGLAWKPTLPPVAIDRWQPLPPGNNWTTVMTWNTYQKPIQYDGHVYGAKELEFGKIESLPRVCPEIALEIAVGGFHIPRDRWRDLGWSVVDSEAISASVGDYQKYIESSRGELSVAKNMYAATRSGWFSCRSVCYLASGRPVILQDTGFSETLPSQEGLLAFADTSSALVAITTVEADYARHQRAARQLAEELFDARLVIGQVLRSVGLS
jgi:hypothetical protein